MQQMEKLAKQATHWKIFTEIFQISLMEIS